MQKRDGPNDMGATATTEIDTEENKDAQSIFERSLIVNKVNRFDFEFYQPVILMITFLDCVMLTKRTKVFIYIS